MSQNLISSDALSYLKGIPGMRDLFYTRGVISVSFKGKQMTIHSTKTTVTIPLEHFSLLTPFKKRSALVKHVLHRRIVTFSFTGSTSGLTEVDKTRALSYLRALFLTVRAF